MEQETQKYVIVTAGGSGTRMGGSLPKQFLPLGDRPVLRVTLECFMEAIPGIHVVTVLPASHMGYWEDYCARETFLCPQRLVEGGFTRFLSVRNALRWIPDEALVAVHDAVRPLVGVALVRRMFDTAERLQAVAPVVPVVDTMKLLSPLREGGEGRCAAQGEEAPDRDRLFAVQTPQVFRGSVLKAAYRTGYAARFTDDASVVEAAGTPVTYLEGERLNFKLTTPEDLRLARALYRADSGSADAFPCAPAGRGL